LVNSFDLVRLHKFGDQDDNVVYGTPTNRLPSYNAMIQFAAADPVVDGMIRTERHQATQDAFSDTGDADDSGEWLLKLKANPNTGKYDKTVDNVMIILENDPLLKDKLAYDEFANRSLALGSLPWDDRTQRRQWTDTDDAGLRHYIEKRYEITGKDKLFDATSLCAFRRRINDVKDYLNTLSWDGVRRLDTLLTAYLGAEDNPYTRAVIRKSLTAAVARVMKPGVKYDYMPILSGPQGIGKSTFLRVLGLNWYSDSLNSFEGKEAREMVQGTWINELGELNGMTRSEITMVKQFLSQQEDIYREPYGRRTNRYPRQCVFFGTTNDSEFLRDRTGNRRFWPVDVGIQTPTKDIFTQLETEVDQIWAEAVVAWQEGEPLYLKGEPERIAIEQQDSHRESSAKEGLILEFIEKPVPVGWEKRSISERKMYWASDFKTTAIEKEERLKVCAAEVWCECFGGDIKFMKRSDSVEINSILTGLKGWDRHASSQRFGPYGTQKGFHKRCQLSPST
jgi:predicted P-loop ATPase